jgi:hypothetical protein
MPTRKNHLMMQETSLNVVIVMHHSPTRFDSIIIELSKVVIRLWMNNITSLCWNLILCLSLAKEKKSVQVAVGNISMLKKALGKTKGFKRAWNHRSLAKKLGGSSGKEKVWDLPLFYCCFHYNKLFIYQCIKLWYQYIKYGCIYNTFVSIYQTLCINATINKRRGDKL